MRIRRTVSSSVAAAVIGALLASAGAVAAQTPGEFQTPWGDPDLQGTWNNITGIPLERPAELSGKEFFTQEEAVQFAQETLRRVDRDRRDGEHRKGRWARVQRILVGSRNEVSDSTEHSDVADRRSDGWSITDVDSAGARASRRASQCPGPEPLVG